MQNTITLLSEVLRGILTILIGLFLIFYLSPELAKFMLLVIPFLIIMVVYFSRKMPASYQSDGFDRSKILFGSAKKTTNDIFWYYPSKPFPGKRENISPVLAVRSGDWKFLMEKDGSRK